MPPSTGIAPITKVTGIRREYRETSDTKRRTHQHAAANAGKRVGKVALQTTGTAVQVGGTVVKTGGSAAMRAGIGLSGTGVGAILGVPLAIAGGIAYGAGTATKVAGKTIRKSSKLIRTDADRKRSSRIGRYTLLFLKWTSISILFFWQIVLVALFLGLLAMQNWSESATIGGAWDRLLDGDFSGALEEAGQSVVTSLIGGDLGVSLAMAAWGFCLAITWFFLFMSLGTILMQKWCKISNISPLNTSRKEVLFIIALVFYAIPVVQAFPWAWFWLRYLSKHGADTE